MLGGQASASGNTCDLKKVVQNLKKQRPCLRLRSGVNINRTSRGRNQRALGQKRFMLFEEGRGSYGGAQKGLNLLGFQVCFIQRFIVIQVHVLFRSWTKTVNKLGCKVPLRVRIKLSNIFGFSEGILSQFMLLVTQTLLEFMLLVTQTCRDLVDRYLLLFSFRFCPTEDWYSSQTFKDLGYIFPMVFGSAFQFHFGILNVLLIVHVNTNRNSIPFHRANPRKSQDLI